MSDLDKFDYECQNQMSIFDMIREPIRITKPIRLIELFAGYGSQAMALERIGAKFEHYRVVEFDKYAIASYNAVHGTSFPTMDITKVHAEDLNICDTEVFTYLLTYSFPCTDLSVAGKQAGMKKGSGTRSGLLWEVERILKEIRDGGGELPQILFMENVPQVHANANMEDFQNWIDFLTSLGYVSYWQDLNAKNYGVAQNRERCFMFSFLGEYNYRFPQPIPLKKRLKDYLEDDVDEKHYINNEKAEKLIKQLIDNGTLPQHNLNRQTDRQTDRQICVDGTINKPQQREIANCIKARYDCGISNQQQVGNIVAKICIDTSMSGLEDGAIRTYIDTAPSITAREYKEPRMILE
jgi:DNA-cytosine methyltransferase|nr:MAG TPA: Cytosine specific methyltransferase [Caudoviricetes sp.]